MKTLAERLKHVRTYRRKVSQADFSARIGLTQTTWGRYERGENIPDASIIARLCQETGVSAYWLLFGQGPMVVEEARAEGKQAGRIQVQVLSLEPTDEAEWYRPLPLPLTVSCDSPMLQAVLVRGDGMVPDGIHNGYVLICDPDRAPDPGDAVYVQRQDGSAAIRRLDHLDDAGANVSHWEVKTGSFQSRQETLAQETIRSLAPVVLVRRKG